MSWEAPYPAERLVPYDDGWPTAYAALAHQVLACLGPGWRAEHVGSTSVPGLVAKPVIDVALRVPQGWTADRAAAAFAALRGSGWSPVAPVGGHLASVLVQDGVRRAVAHLFLGTQWGTAPVRLFADRLRRFPAERDDYAALKERLVAEGTWGERYTAAKGVLVQQVVDRARAERGWPPVEPPPEVQGRLATTHSP